jgi:hypothetical protein
MHAVEALASRGCVRVGDTDLSHHFFSATARQIGPVWAMNRANDRAPSAATPRPCIDGTDIARPAGQPPTPTQITRSVRCRLVRMTFGGRHTIGQHA